jgi:hypothetical protein
MGWKIKKVIKENLLKINLKFKDLENIELKNNK